MLNTLERVLLSRRFSCGVIALKRENKNAKMTSVIIMMKMHGQLVTQLTIIEPMIPVA